MTKSTLAELEKSLRAIALADDAIIKKAIKQANKSHSDQKRDDGSSYLENHIYPVALSVIDYLKNSEKIIHPEIIAGAILHDVLEDDLSIDESKFRYEFGEKVYSLVKSLTKPEKENFLGFDLDEKRKTRNEFYFNNIKNSCFETKIIKLADRLNNILSLDKVTEEKRKRIIKDTKEHYIPLAKKVDDYFLDKIENNLKKYLDTKSFI